MFSLTIRDHHLNCRKQLRESSQLPEVLQKVRVFTCVVAEASPLSPRRYAAAPRGTGKGVLRALNPYCFFSDNAYLYTDKSYFTLHNGS